MTDQVTQETALVNAIISAYHTTRLGEAAPHILSKAKVRALLDEYRIAAEQRGMERERERCLGVEKDDCALDFGNELIFAVIGLETQPVGTVASFEIELRGRKRKVSVQ